MNESTSKIKNISSTKGIRIFLVSLILLFLTFFVSMSNVAFNYKVYTFITVILIYGTIAIKVYSNLFDEDEQDDIENTDSVEFVFSEEMIEKLSVFDEANTFFTASLKPEDMFRLIAARINELVDFQTCVLFIIDKNNVLNARAAAGMNAEEFADISIGCDAGIAGKAFFSELIETDAYLHLDGRAIPKTALEGLNSSLAIPLKKVELGGVLVLYSSTENDFQKTPEVLLEAISERITPLLQSSFAFEKNLLNSMTDSLTELPNERAFHLVLENQLAESQRFPTKRALTVFTFDIKGFSAFNSKYGHKIGDELLQFTADAISCRLRKMDLLARFRNDEFWAIVPTANSELAKLILKRIENSLITDPFKIAGGEVYFLKLNIGSATFGVDGETKKELFQVAELRKSQLKNNENNSVIMFPKENVN